MLISEFAERVGFEPTASEYVNIKRMYMECGLDMDTFCHEWKAEGWIQILCSARIRRIERLEEEISVRCHQCEKAYMLFSRRLAGMNSLPEIMEVEADETKSRYEKLVAQKRKELEAFKAEKKEYGEKLDAIRKAFKTFGILK